MPNQTSLSFPVASLLTILAVALTSHPRLSAQTPTDALPDAPGATAATTTANKSLHPASPYAKYIDPGQSAPALNFRDKFLLGVKDATSPISVGAWVVNAGYEQAINGKPHYGTNRVAFAQRFAAAAARDPSEDLFGESILAPLFREDPRYYILGRSHKPLHRFVYAAPRALITRKDDGTSTINFAQIGGNLAGAALTNAYYPSVDRGVTKTMEIFAGSEGGSALGFVISEFFSGVYETIHLKASSQ